MADSINITFLNLLLDVDTNIGFDNLLVDS